MPAMSISAKAAARKTDGVAFAVERVAPQIGMGGDVGGFSEEAFADGSDEGGRLLLLPGREGRRGAGIGDLLMVGFAGGQAKFT
jgi:hypothetical protein